MFSSFNTYASVQPYRVFQITRNQKNSLAEFDGKVVQNIQHAHEFLEDGEGQLSSRMYRGSKIKKDLLTGWQGILTFSDERAQRYL